MVADFRPWPGLRAPIAGTPHQRPKRIGLHISFYALEGKSSKGGNWTQSGFFGIFLSVRSSMLRHLLTDPQLIVVYSRRRKWNNSRPGSDFSAYRPPKIPVAYQMPLPPRRMSYPKKRCRARTALQCPSENRQQRTHSMAASTRFSPGQLSAHTSRAVIPPGSRATIRRKRVPHL